MTTRGIADIQGSGSRATVFHNPKLDSKAIHVTLKTGCSICCNGSGFKQTEDSMAIKVGDKVPQVTFRTMTSDGPQEVTSDELFSGKKVALFALPGAFTPTCSAKHLPGYVQQADAIKAKGVDTIACTAVNDAFVMGAWGNDQGTGNKVLMLADGSADFATAMGLELDLTGRGMGVRSQRYSMLVDDGVVKTLNVEEAGQFEASDADTMLGQV
jgi:peroxiredoxin